MKLFGFGSILNVHNENWTCCGFKYTVENGWLVNLVNGQEKASLGLSEIEDLLKV